MVGKDWKTLLLTQPELILGEHVAGVGSFMMVTALLKLQESFWVWCCQDDGEFPTCNKLVRGCCEEPLDEL
ncbi:MAG TPA: hypothetical protein DEP88_02000 [Verrucomicrobiales bacterium]|nr:hypothetical protein [Verrucomicrobiales bacterium]